MKRISRRNLLSSAAKIPSLAIVSTAGLAPLSASPVFTDICSIDDDADFDEQLPLSTDEKERLANDQTAGYVELVDTIPSPLPPSTINHLGWPICTRLSSGRYVMAYARQHGHSGGNFNSSGSITSFAGRYVTRSMDLITWDPPHPWPAMAGRVGDIGNVPSGSGAALHCIGSTEISGSPRVVMVTSNKEVLISDDEGATWSEIPGALSGMLNGAVQVGPNMVNHPDFGLLCVFGQETDLSTRRNYIIRSLDHGNTWEERVWINSEMARSVEPAVTVWGPGHMIMIAREYSGSFANPDGRYYHYTQHVYKHDGCDFSEVQFSTMRTNIRGNAIQGQSCHDTAEVIYNPVSGRIEMIQGHRYGGSPGQTGSTAVVGIEDANSAYFAAQIPSVPQTQDEEPVSTLNLWSIDPADLLAGKGDWRFDGTLLKIKGYSTTGCRDGFHPGGSVVDIASGKQHIFIYSGTRRGPCSIFRITRSLDTDKWRGVADPISPPDCDFVNSDGGTENKSSSIRLSPNPASSELFIEVNTKSAMNCQVMIHDVTGVLIDTIHSGSIKNQFSWSYNVSKLKPGVYYATFISEEGMSGERFVVSR